MRTQKKQNKRKSEIPRRKMDFLSEPKQLKNTQKNKKKIFYPKQEKVINDEEEEYIEIKDIAQNKPKNIGFKKEDDSISYFSTTTNKTDENQKSHITFKKQYPPEEPEELEERKDKDKQKKAKSQKKTRKQKGIKEEKEEEEIEETEEVIDFQKSDVKKSNTKICFLNPYYKERKTFGIEEDPNDSDYSEEESVKKVKKKPRKKSKKKSKNDIDIEMKDGTWTIYEFNSKKSIKGQDYLPCREKEQKIIYDYIQEGLQTNGNYNSLYIAGMPGTGKTACVKTVINIIESEISENNKKNYRKKSKEKDLPTFTKLFICGTDYPSISNVYKTIYKFIFSTKRNQSSKKCVNILNKFFSSRNSYNIAQLNDPTNSHIILVVDEIDFLINRDQKLLYNIFNWTTYEEAKLIVISISNTLDLPNHLSPKIKSRMGNNKLMFKPYVKDELIEIIKYKGIEYEKFTSDAIKLSCMKVAAINGDLRRIIQILTRAKEIYNLDNKKGRSKTIDKNYILTACEELFNSKLIKVIQSLQISEKIIVCAILSKIKDDNDNKIKVGELYDKKDIFINKYNESIGKNKLDILWEEYKKIIYNLVRIQLIYFCDKNSSNFMENSISIKFYTDEFINACNEDKELKPVLDYLTTLIEV